MRQFNGYKPTKPVSSEPLPAGGYVAKILKAEVQQTQWGEKLILSFDIADGPHRDFFANQYRNNPNEDKKWKGVYRLNVPADDGSEQDERNKRTFNGAIWAVEDSNTGYHFNWDERTLVGKFVGVLYRNKEWEFNGRTGWTTECCALESVVNVREGKFKMPKDKPLAQKSDAQSAYESGGEYPAFVEVKGSLDDELPF
jgi:hypothetical protein